MFCSVGSYDSYMRIFAYLKWNFITELPHRSRITEGDGIQIYKEEEFREGEPYGGKDIRITSRYVMCELPVVLQPQKIKASDPSAPFGVSILEWSCDSRYIATKNDNTPNVLWIWDMSTLSLSVMLIHDKPIRCAKWSSKTHHLAFCTGSPRLFLWSFEGASICDIPLENHEFNV